MSKTSEPFGSGVIVVHSYVNLYSGIQVVFKVGFICSLRVDPAQGSSRRNGML